MELHPRAPQAGYGAFLREHDVGLALMFTPHPSLVPLEMASAGLVTVTNTFENKTAAAMEAISPNLIAAEPGVSAIAAALETAAARADDARRGCAAARWAGRGTGARRSPTTCWTAWSVCSARNV